MFLFNDPMANLLFDLISMVNSVDGARADHLAPEVAAAEKFRLLDHPTNHQRPKQHQPIAYRLSLSGDVSRLDGCARLERPAPGVPAAGDPPGALQPQQAGHGHTSAHRLPPETRPRVALCACARCRASEWSVVLCLPYTGVYFS